MYEHLALLRADYLGVYNYQVIKNKMIYYSFFGREGLYKVIYNLDTNEEKRSHLKYVRIPKRIQYNYFIG